MRHTPYLNGGGRLKTVFDCIGTGFSDGLWGGRNRVRGLRHTPYLNGGGRLKTQFRHSQKRFQTASGRIDQ
ncbi:hypothetical protein [Neisseria bacilliformis]|uniref:hypothetical protein n=1 Tax=Neisseria bacilliformis TaxID=267212 RepID=UPI0028E4B088|nr:hypothetical protein [Neisseria bacilliformis]